MSKQFAVLHISKGSSNSSGLGAHIDRTYTPKNADPEKEELNEHHFITENTLKQDIDIRLAEVGCKVRSNSVKSINIILSGSHEKMKEIEKNPELYRDWVNDNRKFVADKYGEENVMRFAVHRDERTPHIHCVVTPITKDGRLSAKEIVGNRNDLMQLQEDYGQAMNKYGLNRGVKGSKATHDTIAEYYARINDPLSAEISIPLPKLTESNKKYAKKLNEAILPLKINLEKLDKENTGLKQVVIETGNFKKHLDDKEKQIKLEEERIELKQIQFEKNKKKQLMTEFSKGVDVGNKEIIRVINAGLERQNKIERVKLLEHGNIKWFVPELPKIEMKQEPEKKIEKKQEPKKKIEPKRDHKPKFNRF